MQYVQRPAQPWAIGTIASCQPSPVDSRSAARSPHAVPAPSSPTISGHFRGGSSLARGTIDRTRSRCAAAMQPATTSGLSYAASSVMRRTILRSVVSTTVHVTRTCASASCSDATIA